MSQSGAYGGGSTPPTGSILTLTGNDAVAVGPNVAGNINIVGDGTVVDVTGDAGTNTLTITLTSSGGTEEFDTDTDPATPAGGIIVMKGGTNINTAGATNVVTFNLDDTVVLTGSLTAGTGLTTNTGDVDIVAGNLDLPNTSSDATEGVINLNGTPFIQNLGNNIIIGKGAGNFTFTIGDAINNTIIGSGAFGDVTIGANNTVIGEDAMLSATSASNNTTVGVSSLAGITSGTGNTVYGALSGSNLLSNESNNILVGSPGVVDDEGTIRIGVQGTGDLEQNQCFIAGIVGNTVSNAEFVTVDSTTGQLGVSSGSGLVNQFDTDTTPAFPSGGIITMAGGSNMNTSGSGSTVTFNLDNTVSISGSLTAGTGLTATSGGITATGISNINNTGSALTTIGTGGTGAVHIGNATGNTAVTGTLTSSAGITATTGNITSTAGNLVMPGTTSSTGGALMASTNRILHHFGTNNLFVGIFAGNITLSGGSNSGFGANSLGALTTGQSNSAFGNSSLARATTGIQNCALGSLVLDNLTSGTGNVVAGYQAAMNLLTGSFNTILGNESGSSYGNSETSNILISNSGTGSESNAIHIGTQGTGSNQQNKCFIAGITGNTVSNAQLVAINSATGQLGVTSASGVTWQVVTGATPLVEGNGYFVNGSSTLQFTLPVNAAVGDTFQIAVLDTAVNGWQINQNASQYIIGNTTTALAKTTTVGTGGNVATNNGAGLGAWTNATLICAIANTAFVLEYSNGGIITFT